jgi:TRAP transporter TAXI family solute receptor
MKTMNRTRFALGILLLTTLIAGCAGDTSTGGAASRKFLSLGTAPPGGAFFVVGGAISEVLNETSEGWDVTAESTRGSQENIRRLDAGEIDLALSNSAISYFAVRGEGAWDKEYAIRAVMTLAPNVALFITPSNSGVKTIGDLKGKRVVAGPAGAGFEYFIRPLIEAHGVTYDDFTALNAGQAGAVDMLADGSAAAAFLGGAVPTASITQAAASQDIFFVPFDEATMGRLTQDYVFFRRATIPAGTYRNQDQDFSGLDVGSMHLLTSTAHDEDLVYQLTKAIYEGRESVVQKHPAGRAINPDNAVRDTGTPFHPGAVRYYKEIGIWPADR